MGSDTVAYSTENVSVENVLDRHQVVVLPKYWTSRTFVQSAYFANSQQVSNGQVPENTGVVFSIV